MNTPIIDRIVFINGINHEMSDWLDSASQYFNLNNCLKTNLIVIIDNKYKTEIINKVILLRI